MASRTYGEEDRPGRGWFTFAELEEIFGITEKTIRSQYLNYLKRPDEYQPGSAGRSKSYILSSAFLRVRYPNGPGDFTRPTKFQSRNGNGHGQFRADGDESEDANAPISDALERLRTAKAKQEEIRLEQMKGEICTVGAVREFVAKVARIQRDAVDRLQRQFGPDAYEIMEEARQQMIQAADEFRPVRK